MSGGIDASTAVVWGGFAIAFVFGVVASKTNFCTMGAISDVVNMAHWGRIRMWLLAIAVAMLGANLLHYLGLVDLGASIYQRPALPWLSLLAGGLLFGAGMTLAGGCTNKNLLRLGAGSLRSLVVLVFVGLFAYMTLKGLFGQWRAAYLDPVRLDLGAWGLSGQGLGELLAKATGLPQASARLLLSAVLALALLLFVFKEKRFRDNWLQSGGAVVLGLLVVAGWFVTGHLGHGEDPQTMETVYFATNTRTLESLSFVAPTAFGLELLMLWTDQSLHASFGIATVLGVLLGAFAYAIATRQFRWEGFASVQDLRTQLLGAMLMGFGGVTALGCTIGQGLSGVSTLAIGSLLALFALVAGAAATMKYQAWRA